MKISHTNNHIPKVKFHEPERNLPGRRPYTITAETRFTIEFAKAYINQYKSIHHRSIKNEIICVRQIAINGFGIADLMSISWTPSKIYKTSITVDDFIKNYRPTVRAFEVKLTNWKKGMTQAHRYRYFADVAILVLPNELISKSLEYLETFRKISVGLWAFNKDSKRIVSYYTPRPTSALEYKYKNRALQIIAKTSKALPFVRIT